MDLGDLKDARWILLKGGLFLLAGCMAVAALLLAHPDWQTVTLLTLSVFCFCRFYYFCFYVIEKYVDSEFRYAGLTSVIAYLWRRQRR